MTEQRTPPKRVIRVSETGTLYDDDAIERLFRQRVQARHDEWLAEQRRVRQERAS